MKIKGENTKKCVFTRENALKKRKKMVKNEFFNFETFFFIEAKTKFQTSKIPFLVIKGSKKVIKKRKSGQSFQVVNVKNL